MQLNFLIELFIFLLFQRDVTTFVIADFFEIPIYVLCLSPDDVMLQAKYIKTDGGIIKKDMCTLNYSLNR